ncbi:MAG: O-antigen polymerase [Thiomonas sp. 14-64-326]|jgi:O-antigen ligase|uniref:O-antigen ligase family protein n=1 Tax=Thiomonas sp. TaxID=2047785 RepID=UPI000BC609D0|nr:O-antigen ligase family protein [Thiomonas sp.]OZB75205.1 MAG: O-antigen polymerase [Thiomonas sp. 14-64-326]
MSVTTPHPRQKPGGLNNRRPASAPSVENPAENPVENANWAGKELYSILRLLAVPALFVLSIIVFKLHPGKIGLYGFALIFGLLLLVQLRKGPEPLLALVIIYYPLSKLYPVLIAPGINGTNLLELFLISFWVMHAYKNQRKMFNPLPFTRLVGIWFFLSVISVFTAIYHIGLHPFIWNYLLSARGFFDQFIIFFLVVNLIQDKNMARRLIVYMMFSAAVIFLYGIHEWWLTRGASSIEKSRLLGPIGQPNEFAAQIIYSLAPLLAYGAYYFPRWKSWRLAPIVLIGLKVLLAAFSRGAYLAFAMELATLSFVKSKKFFVLVLLVIGTIYFFIPALVPNSMKARVAQTYQDHEVDSKIDKSADSRFLLWDAAIEMAKEDPIFGKGFDQFHSLVPSYVPGFYEGSTGDATDNQNMFLYAASNMGVPSLITLLLIIGALAFRGWFVYKKSTVDIDRIIGLGAVTLVAGLVAVNMFGTHIIDTSVDVFLWIYIAIVAHLFDPKQLISAKNRNG